MQANYIMNKKVLHRTLIYLTILILIIIWTLPILWMIIASFLPYQRIIAFDFSWESITINNYYNLFYTDNFLEYLRNSCLITFIGTTGAVGFGSFTALYSVRNKSFGEFFIYWIVSTRIIPPAVFLLPAYIMFKNLGLLNNIITLIILGFALNYSLVVWLMRNIFKQIPQEMEFSALVDGASRLRAFYDTTMRYSIHGLTFVSLFSAIFIWNEYLLSMVLTLDSKAQPLTILLGQTLSLVKQDWGLLFAIGTIQIIPIVVFGILSVILFKLSKIKYLKTETVR
jgi:ABC-type glycerol-3-phosphate transport system permease component